MSTPPAGVRIAVVEDHQLFAEVLQVSLRLEGHEVTCAETAGPGTSSAAVLSAVLRARPHVVLLDLDLGRLGSGLRLIEPLRRSGAAVVVVTATQDRVQWGECLLQGARAVVSKSAPLSALLGTVGHAVRGGAAMPDEERAELISRFHRDRADLLELSRRMDSLTAREREVLGHLMAGRPVSEIAAVAVVSEATVRTHVRAVLAKLRVTSQLAAVSAAHRLARHRSGSA